MYKELIRKLNGRVVRLYNFIVSMRLINLDNKVCRKVRKILFHNICYNCEANFGRKNPDKLIYIIRCSNEKIGLFGLYNHVVSHLRKAEELGAAPVVDWQYYPNSGILEDNLVGKENAWEYYFEQLSEISLKDAYLSRNVIMSSGNVTGSLGEVWQEEEVMHSNALIGRYIKLNQVCQSLVNEKYEELHMAENSVLGVLCRGTDFTAARPKGHAICPSVEATVNTIREMQIKWGTFDKIFLATEDDAIFRKMQDTFQEKLIFCQKNRISDSSGRWLNELYECSECREIKKVMMQEYLTSIYLLAKCDALIAPVVGGTLGAMRIKGKFDKIFLFQLGNY